MTVYPQICVLDIYGLYLYKYILSPLYNKCMYMSSCVYALEGMGIYVSIHVTVNMVWSAVSLNYEIQTAVCVHT